MKLTKLAFLMMTLSLGSLVHARPISVSLQLSSDSAKDGDVITYTYSHNSTEPGAALSIMACPSDWDGSLRSSTCFNVINPETDLPGFDSNSGSVQMQLPSLSIWGSERVVFKIFARVWSHSRKKANTAYDSSGLLLEVTK